MAYAQWISVSIQPRGLEVSIKNVQLRWGKFYGKSRDEEIDKSVIGKMTIKSGNYGDINSCGRSDASSGTDGQFDLYDGNVKIGTFTWDCPWGSKTNIVRWEGNHHDNYFTEVTGGNLDSGAIGRVTIKCAKLP